MNVILKIYFKFVIIVVIYNFLIFEVCVFYLMGKNNSLYFDLYREIYKIFKV